jgi:hypothetical protein
MSAGGIELGAAACVPLEQVPAARPGAEYCRSTQGNSLYNPTQAISSTFDYCCLVDALSYENLQSPWTATRRVQAALNR